jgi:DNA mismatch endonuclease, patch repair protein
VDSLSKDQRSKQMALIKNKDTRPERMVRQLVYHLGYRYRLHDGRLPGRPDIVLSKTRKVIFVHGCFWHRHSNCKNARLPKSKLDFWLPKLESNKMRDTRTRARLRQLGWRVFVVWECQLKRVDGLAARLQSFLDK